MIHIATVHHKSDQWIDIQLSYLRLHLHEPYRVVANLESVPGHHEHKFDQVVPARGRHPGKLNLLASRIVADAEPDDLIMFLDGDAFPVADPMPTVHKALDESVLVAVRRAENNADRQPHPCFSVMRVADWDQLRGDWSPGHCWTNDRGQIVTDTGANLLDKLERAQAPWTPLVRSNRVNPHPLWFAVYGGIVYHHGAGFRDPMSRNRADARARPLADHGHFRVVGSTIRHARKAQDKVWGYRQMQANRRLGDEIFAKLERDPKFYLEFL